MEQLRPRIRPKAPASLKENVLKAVSQDGLLANRQAEQSSRRAATWRITLAAAAVLLLGIMTFVLWLNRDRHNSHESAPVLIAEKAGKEAVTKAVKEAVTNVVKEVGEAVSHKYAEPSATVTTHTEAKTKTTTTAPLSTHQKTTATSHSAQPATPVLSHPTQPATPVLSHPAQQPTASKFLAASSSTVGSPTATSQAEQHSTSLPHREGQGVGLSPLERQLLANFEAHRDLVNARLAEELAQARFTQERIGQTTREYLQQCLDLQERITQQLREDIEDIAPEKNNPKEV